MREELAAKQRAEARRREREASAAAAAEALATAAAATSSLSAPAWLLTGIVVKVLNERVGGGRYFGKKGVVLRVETDGFVAQVRMADSGDVLRVDQQDLETVVPAAGGAVLIVGGVRRGSRAELVALHVEDFAADLRLDGLGELLRAVPFEDFSRAAS